MNIYLFKILKDLLNSKDFKEKKGWFGPFTSGTLEKKSEFRSNNREHGGPIESGKPYVVGEKGPEIIIPTSDGNVRGAVGVAGARSGVTVSVQ